MRGFLVFFLAAAAATSAVAQTIPSPGEMSIDSTSPASAGDRSPPQVSPVPKTSSPHGTSGSTDDAAAMDHLVRSNQELLDLLKKQQAVLEDIQYDRRLQNRQIALLEQRLEETLQLNAALQAKEARLEAAAADHASGSSTNQGVSTSAPPAAPPDNPAPPPPPASALPPEQAEGAPGTSWWHRTLSLSGEDSKETDTFHIGGKQWRVLWHNQDKAGDTYKNTSALFISAFPKNDTMPKKVCSQLGTGGDITELTGQGDFYLKIEASGGKWELAVEDLH